MTEQNSNAAWRKHRSSHLSSPFLNVQPPSPASPSASVAQPLSRRCQFCSIASALPSCPVPFLLLICSALFWHLVLAEYERKHKTEKLEELGNMLTGLDAGDSIVIAKSFSHMLNLANLAEEVQIAYRRRIKLLKKGDFADENSAITEPDIEETFKRLVTELKKSPQEVFDALKKQTVDLVITAHPTQSVRRSLLQKHGRAGRIP
ncbi:hypothetical protein Ahy_B03g067948 [Arachis hypogaea]|uniref:Phosphoenolpyruvate carboxylase n=2 Tax=Arachis hypogaea TaxID=3818 RepID=A0A445A8A8_ARAHY|nr:hypothetical protein Ahy_B03g067948 [Arachis hypogaea]